MKNILTIAIPTYNYFEGFLRNIEILDHQISSGKYTISILISDDSNNSDVENFYWTNFAKNPVYTFKKGPRKGAVANWNQCIEANDSIYSLFIHTDEYIESKEFIRTLIPILETLEYDVIVLPLKKVTKTKSYIHYPHFFKYLFLLFPQLLFACNPFGSPSVFIFKNELRNEFDESLRWFVDVEWYYQFLIKRPKVKIINDKLLGVCSDLSFPNSITASLDVRQLRIYEANLISKKHCVNLLLFSIVFRFLRLPVKIYEWFLFDRKRP